MTVKQMWLSLGVFRCTSELFKPFLSLSFEVSTSGQSGVTQFGHDVIIHLVWKTRRTTALLISLHVIQLADFSQCDKIRGDRALHPRPREAVCLPECFFKCSVPSVPA